MNNNIIIRAGKYLKGQVIRSNYVGQVSPADLSAIIWYHESGDDTTGNGSWATPYETRARANQDVTSTEYYVLNCADYCFEFDSTKKVYLDLTSGNDANTGLTVGSPLLTYSAAVTVLDANPSRTAIEILDSATLTARITRPTQGVIGEDLEFNAVPVQDWNFTALNIGQGSSVVQNMYSDDSIIIAVCQNGKILVSTDGLTFTSRVSGTTETLTWVKKINGVFVAGGANGSLVTSPDAITWTARDIGFSTSATYDADYFNSLYIVVGAGGKLATSSDLQTWVIRTSNFSSSDIRSVCTAGAVAVITGADAKISSSADGITWTARTSNMPVASHEIRRVKHDGTAFVAAGGAIGRGAAVRSTDGTTWTLVADFSGPGSLFQSLNYSTGLWIASGNSGFLATSPDGVTWTSRTSGHGTSTITALGYFDGAHLSGDLDGVVTTSTDGVTWTSRLTGAGQVNSFGNFRGKLFIQGTGTNSVNYTNQSSNITPTGKLCNAVLNAAAMNKIDHGTIQNVTGNNTSVPCVTSAQGLVATRCNLVTTTADTVVIDNLEGSEFSESLIKSDNTALKIYGYAETANSAKFLQNTIVGEIEFVNDGALKLELFRDNLIQGNVTAVVPVYMQSGNAYGTVTSGVASLSGISKIDPGFKSGSDFRLKRTAEGDATDSNFINYSKFYSYTDGTDTYKTDFGCYQTDISLLEVAWANARELPKPTGPNMRFTVENAAALLKSRTRRLDVANFPERRIEIIDLVFTSFDLEQVAFLEYLEQLKPPICQIAIDPEDTPDASVTASGIQAAGSRIITIQSASVRPGSKVLHDGIYYQVLVATDTQLVFHRELATAIPDLTVLEVTSQGGFVDCLFVPTTRPSSRAFPTNPEYLTNVAMQFVRNL
jgi:hypothetical protein